MWRRQLDEKRRKRPDVTSTLQPADFLQMFGNTVNEALMTVYILYKRNTAAFIPRADFTRLCSAISQSSFLSSCSAAVVCFNIRSDQRGKLRLPGCISSRRRPITELHVLYTSLLKLKRLPETFSDLGQFVITSAAAISIETAAEAHGYCSVQSRRPNWEKKVIKWKEMIKTHNENISLCGEKLIKHPLKLTRRRYCLNELTSLINTLTLSFHRISSTFSGDIIDYYDGNKDSVYDWINEWYKQTIIWVKTEFFCQRNSHFFL